MTHTPAPWLHRGKNDSVHAAPTPEEYAAGYRLGQFIFRFDEDEGPSDEDLNLILRAPDTLAALKELRHRYLVLLEIGRDRLRDYGCECDPLEVMERNDPSLRAADAAIAAAEGNA